MLLADPLSLCAGIWFECWRFFLGRVSGVLLWAPDTL